MATRTPKSRLRAPERRCLIVEAALDEFAERGYEAASMGRIAEAAGVSRTVLYDHFPSKQALFEDLLQTQHATLLRYMSEALASEAPMRERMEATFDAFFRFAEDRPLAWRILFPERPPVDPTVAEAHRRCRVEANRLLADVLEPDAREAGIDPASTVGRVVFAIHQESLHGAVRWWHAHPEVPRGQLVRGVMVALWSGLGGARSA
jgi:AcrR family transcriptional regulator